jgi:hypothetical protein
VPDFALGRLPADPSQPKLKLRRLAAAAPQAPASADWLSAVARWGIKVR